jgi:hypothetical protein
MIEWNTCCGGVQLLGVAMTEERQVYFLSWNVEVGMIVPDRSRP